ncbi:MAG: lamin tail domain-containing protein, partial [Patescibacteria group bacterium]
TSTEVSFCSFETNQKPRRDSLILSEVAWMGSTRSAQEEWLEVQNVSGKPLDVSGFQLIDLKEDIKIRFLSGARIGANGFYLFERSEGAVPKVKADVLYSGSLANDGEGVRLYDADCNLLDEVLTGSPWAAGNNTTKQTMERSPELAWQTSVLPGGTPRAVNSIPVVTEELEKDPDAKSLEELREDKKSLSATSSRGEIGSPQEIRSPVGGGTTSYAKCSYETSAFPRGGGVRLNEVALMGTTRDANDE